jgi:fluoride ion exporter CrcB/FEX
MDVSRTPCAIALVFPYHCPCRAAFASWNLQATRMLVSGQWVRALWALVLGTEVAMASFALGGDCMKAIQALAASVASRSRRLRVPNTVNLHRSDAYQPALARRVVAVPPEREAPSSQDADSRSPVAALSEVNGAVQNCYACQLAIFTTVAIALLSACIAAYVEDSNWSRRTIYLSCAIGPVGALLRWQLAELLNSKTPRFPAGTFLANTIASTTDASLAGAVLALSRGDHRRAVAQAGIAGFGGALSTVSTWVTELSALRGGDGASTAWAYVYGSASLAAAQIIGIALFGGTAWAKGLTGKIV